MTRMNKLSALAAVTALSLGLAACGGGGGSTAGTDPDPTQDPQPMAVDMSNVTTGGADYMAPADGRLVIVAGMSETSGDVTFMCAAGGADCDVTIADGTATYTGGMVTAMDSSAYTTRRANAAEEQRQMDVRDARSAAMQSYMDADADAMKAEAQADEAEATAPGTPDAVAARQAATDARTAATAAKAAHDAIMDGMTKAEADAEARKAADEAVKAKASYMMAKMENDDIQTSAQIGEQQQEARDLAAAKSATKEAADSVAEHLAAVVEKARDAQTQANAARSAADQAMSARRDYANANKYALMAEADATDAAAALVRARQANTDAQAALEAANAAETSEAAEAQQVLAEAADDIAEEAHTGMTGAGMAYMDAKTAAEKAAEYAGMNVLDILSTLNAEEITSATAKTAQLSALNTHLAAMADEAINGNANAATTVAVTWNHAGGAGPDGDISTPTDNIDPGEGALSIVITPAGAEAATLTRDDPDTADDEQNFMAGIGLGDFAEYHIAGAANAGRDRTLTIVFTDKEQASPPILASTANFQRAVPVASRLSTFTGGTANYDHDGDSRTPPIAVTVTCPDGATCNAPVDAQGNVISVTGYRISTAEAGVNVAAVSEAEDNTYIAFGMWLAVDDNGVETFGAFDFGGTATTAVTPVTGSATYNGKAAGVHNTSDATNFFHADATLNANFGDAAALGSITGRIHNIMSGGTAVDHDIILDAIDDDTATAGVQSINAAGAFDGRARMGAGVTDPQTGIVSYPYDGVWSGQFYNAAAASAPAGTAPMSAAGTFGVTHTEDMGTTATTDDEMSSFVGAFGAHKN